MHDEWVAAAQKRFEHLIEQEHGGLARSPYAEGYWYAAYSFIPPFQDCSLRDLGSRLSDIEPSVTGWPIGIVLDRESEKPRPVKGCVEVWLGDTEDAAGQSDFWRLSPRGQFITFRNYQEDEAYWRKGKPGRTFDFILPIWRIGEVLLHARNLAEAVSASPDSLLFTAAWNGLSGRRLVSSGSRYFSPGSRSRQFEVAVRKEIDFAAVETDRVEVVHEMLKPLYAAFGFFSVSKKTVGRELERMLEGF